MIALIQRVNKASVIVATKTISKIDKGLLILLGIRFDDSEKDIDYLVSKISKLRLMPNIDDTKDSFSKSITDLGLKALVVSQFTLYADCKKGNRPSFTDSMNSIDAKVLYESFIKKLKNAGVKVETGEFGAMMEIESVNNGPVTINLTSDHLKDKKYID